MSYRNTIVATKELLNEAGISDMMLEAGIAAFCEYDCRFEGPEEAVFRIYTAMRRLERSLAHDASTA